MYLYCNWIFYKNFFKYLSSCDNNINAIYVRGSSCHTESKYVPWDIDVICFHKKSYILSKESYKFIFNEVTTFNIDANLKKIPHIDLSIHPFIESLDISNVHLFLKLSYSHLHLYGKEIDFKLLQTISTELKYQLLELELKFIDNKRSSLQEEVNPLFYTLKYKHLVKIILRLGNIIEFLFSSDNFFSRDVKRGLDFLVNEYQLPKLNFLYHNLSSENITDRIKIIDLWNQLVRVINYKIKWN